ncbi:MAG TPA: CoA-binding protein [Planctomycetota bacterium]|nr:CoA-binding protein [Planctomycetota bacterium]
MDPAPNALDSLRRPRSIAIVGASADGSKAGGVILAGLLSGTFPGPVWPVNPRHGSLLGRPCFPSLAALPSMPELVIVATPAAAAPDAVREAAAVGARAVVVVASGFAEAGEEGRRIQDGMRDVARAAGMRLLGPNGLGVMDPRSGVDSFFIPAGRLGRPRPGPIAVLSQSGVFALAAVERLSHEGPGVSLALSYGNRADLGESDALEALADDPGTGAVALVMESVDDGPRFLHAAARCAALKPVVALKCGRGEAGAAAVRSHTGALAGRAAIYGAAFHRAGVVEARGLDDLLDGAKALAMQPPAPGRRLLVVTNGGGFGAACADAAAAEGLDLPPVAGTAATALRERLASFASPRNPVDVTAVAADGDFGAVLDAAFVPAGSPFDAAIVSCLSAAPGITEGIARRIAVAGREAGRPVVALHLGGARGVAIGRALESAGVPVYPTPERAVAAVRALVLRGEAVARTRVATRAGRRRAARHEAVLS